jgi:hypothetical protein
VRNGYQVREAVVVARVELIEEMLAGIATLPSGQRG